MAAPTIISPATPSTPSSPFPSSFTTDDSDRDFDDNYNQSQDTFSNTPKPISVGWIVGIVVIVLAIKLALIIAILMYRRRKRERPVQINAEPKPNPNRPAPVYGGPSELVGQEPPLRHEIPNTEVLPREMPNNEIARPPPPKDASHSSQPTELPV
ncbi:hypothetical protein F4818DRAFT_436453 [Hypoxylon cercidicola]|nr:hypothetical protein F4818DRAFT_436453 [Hypoxylon cercidicola]